MVACLRGDWLTQGPQVKQFEEALCEATGARFAVAVSSGTAALHLAALAAGVKTGDTGITSAITFVASANCIAYCGGSPKFADVDPDTCLMDVASLDRCVGELEEAGHPPKVIVAVDFAGQPADLPAIRTIADQCGAKVVSDAAHSLGGSYAHCGVEYRSGSCAHTDMAVLSFHPVKHITTGEGGALLTNDANVAETAREVRSHGIHRDPDRMTRSGEGPWYYEQIRLGYHYRLTDLQCALGSSQLRKLGQFVARRNEIARDYIAALAEPPLLGWLMPLRVLPTTVSHAYHLFVVRLVRRPGESLDSLAARRKSLYMALRGRQILTQVHYIPVPDQPYYSIRGCSVDGARDYYAGCLSLPMFPKMSAGDIERVVSALRECSKTG